MDTLTDKTIEKIVEYALGFLPETGSIDWDDLLYRIEDAFDIDLGDSMISPEIKKLQREIRAARKAANE